MLCGAALGAASLAGCAAPPSALAQIQDDTALLIAGLHSVMPSLTAMPPAVLPPDRLAEIRMNIDEASLFAGDIASAQDVAQTVTPVQSMAEAINNVARIAAPLHLPPQLRSVLAAADGLLPAIEAPSGDRVALAFYSPDQARLILRQTTVKRV